VQIGDVPIGCYGGNIEGDITGDMRAIDKNGRIAQRVVTSIDQARDAEAYLKALETCPV